MSQAVPRPAVVTLLAGLVLLNSLAGGAQQPDPIDSLLESAGIDPDSGELGSTEQFDAYDWKWGELFFAQRYPSKLTIGNKCNSDELVDIIVDGDLSPLLIVEEQVTALAKRTTDIRLEIVTPLRPPAGPGGTPAPTDPFEQFQEVKGRLLLKATNPSVDCIGKPKIYQAGGHIHGSPGTGGGGNPESCLSYWLAGRLPEPPQDCTEEFRGLARHYLESLAGPDDASGAWAWLPDAREIDTMTASELLEMKNRAETRRLAGGGTPL